MKQWILENPEAALALGVLLFNLLVEGVSKVAPKAGEMLGTLGPHVRGFLGLAMKKPELPKGDK